jgi:hypothetical protein
MATKRGGWIITPAGGAGADPRVLDCDETGGAVAETIAALTAASLLKKAPTPAAARDAADDVRYPHGGAPQVAVRKAVQVTLPEEDESVNVSAAEMPAEERVAALHPPPAADTAEARPADRVPPVSANTLVARICSLR